MCVADCERFREPDAIPDIVRNRLVSFRAFRSDGLMIYDANEIVEGTNTSRWYVGSWPATMLPTSTPTPPKLAASSATLSAREPLSCRR